MLVKEEVTRESGGTGFRRPSSYCAFSVWNVHPSSLHLGVSVCDSPLVEMLDEAENSEASTIECSEDEEWIENIGRALVSCRKCFGSW